MKYYAGVDLGGTNIVCGLLDEQFQLLRKLKLPTEAAKGGDHVVAKIAGMIDELISQHNITREDVQAIGAGIPGLINPVDGICNFSANLSWKDFRVSEKLNQLLGIPVYIDNDVRMYVLGEAARGSGQGYPVVLGITIGTGVAAALVENGRLYYGGSFIAGEIGHIRMDGEEAVCGCGLTGCLETVASATGLARQAREAVKSGVPTIMSSMVPDPSALTATHLSQAYDRGDQAAIDIMTHTGKLLGKGLSYAVTLLNPDVIVIGGGGANAGERLLGPMKQELQRLVLPMYWNHLEIKTAELLDDAGVIGSAVNACNRVQQ
ncbi:ROK family protein [Paenibacillus sp. J2TS4]|uniref:ROK family protein n=1 Tax=Paenibacillus sp. J2TS4 TaxID=2807194 RepID=UPI001B13C906|nr:ROK family protein [Paenibacillus sp. J2TS4]GIP32732.1 glucokinase [Paenibacillus sp. J2TS4]